MAFTIRNPVVGAQAIAVTSTVQNHPIGMIVDADDPVLGAGRFIYMVGVASTVVGSAALLDFGTPATTLAVANDIGAIGFAMSINVASQYGWYQIRGKAVAKVLAAYADNGKAFLTATAGSLDDAVVTGDLVLGAKGASAIDTPSTGLAYMEIWDPQVTDILG